VGQRIPAFRLSSGRDGEGGANLLEFPPMQMGASFNLAAVKEKLDKKMAAHAAQ
jgi:hypothetical protein